MKKFVFLYTELAGYVVKCINQLCSENRAKAWVIAYPVAEEAPFEFDLAEGVTLLKRTEFNTSKLIDLIQEVDPFAVVCSGWSDKEYLTAIKNDDRRFKLLAFDNQWHGTLKQIAATLLMGKKFTSWFTHAFVPGQPQVTFAKKLGFKENRIITGVYCCDYELFRKYETGLTKDSNQNPAFIYVGRYIHKKGISDLFQAFSELVEEHDLNWKLHCVGTGELFDERMIHPQIVHHGFVQPNELRSIVEQSNVLILPSHFEPWGVVVHEYAACGMPMILSDKIGAGTKFLRNGENGFTFKSGNVPDLKDKMKLISEMTIQELTEMGKVSADLASEHTPEIWAQSLLQIV